MSDSNANFESNPHSKFRPDGSVRSSEARDGKRSGTSIDLSGERLGDYQLMRLLGQGGMAEVYLAEQCSLKRFVAFKVLKPDLAADAQYLRRFRNEAQAVAALAHANIVQIHEVGCLQGWQFIAQEYVAGQNLKQLLDRERTLDSERTMVILSQVAEALRKAHTLGIVHRDIKPENILLNSEGVVKVADFGLARQAAAETDLTQVGITMGTPLYMSPEQIEGNSLDGRSDIYSLGVTAYQMLAGHPPFEGDSPLSVALQHVKESPRPLTEFRDDLPQALLDLIAKMLAKSPAERYESAASLALELDRIAGGQAGPKGATAALAASVAEATSGSTHHTLAETQQLARLLGTEKPDDSISPQGGIASGLGPLRGAANNGSRLIPWFVVLMAALVGGTLAWATRPQDPLRVADAEITRIAVPRKSNATAQFFYATMADTEQAWRSVGEYFPLEETESEKERLEVLRSKWQLAYWYLVHDRPAESIPYLEELVALGEIDNDLRARGLAGQAMAYERMGDAEQAANVLADALSLGDFLDEPILRRLEELGRELKARLR